MLPLTDRWRWFALGLVFHPDCSLGEGTPSAPLGTYTGPSENTEIYFACLNINAMEIKLLFQKPLLPLYFSSTELTPKECRNKQTCVRLCGQTKSPTPYWDAWRTCCVTSQWPVLGLEQLWRRNHRVGLYLHQDRLFNGPGVGKAQGQVPPAVAHLPHCPVVSHSFLESKTQS